MTAQLLPLLPLWGILGFVVLWLVPRRENVIGGLALALTLGHMALTLVVIALFLGGGAWPVRTREWVLFEDEHFRFFLALYLDRVSATFLCVLTLLTFLVSVYAREYLHREARYGKFFLTLALFQFGYTWIVLADGFEMLFAGWEVVGVASFVLISFYSHRIRPVKNAMRVFSVYRLGDLGLLLAGWMAHTLVHTNPSFAGLATVGLPADVADRPELIALGAAIVLAAVVKSAQFPFSYWLPKAMEGPTPSSAIFYGSLSVHLGVFLLLRTEPLWAGSATVRALILGLGLVTVVMATGMAHVQSNIKAQLGYASVAQVGLMFMEIALGWTGLALFHFAGHAFLRAYQILVSASVASYLIEHHNTLRTRESWFPNSFLQNLPPRLRATLYVLTIREGFLEEWVEGFLWRPLKVLGSLAHPLFQAHPAAQLFLGSVLLLAMGFTHYALPADGMAIFCSFLAAAGLLAAFVERESSFRAWNLVGLAQVFLMGAVLREDHVPAAQIFMFLSGVTVFWLAGAMTLRWIGARSLNGYRTAERLSGFQEAAFLVCGLGLSGFPISPTFIGEDLILNHALKDHAWLAGLISFCFVLTGLAVIRIFARTCLGPRPARLAEPPVRVQPTEDAESILANAQPQTPS